MSKIKTVIFDLDGTLADTLPLCISAFRQSIEPLIGKSLSDAEIIATFGPSEEGTIMALAPNHYEQGIAAYLKHYKALHDMCPAPFPGITNLLDILKSKGIHIAMVTGKGEHSAAISLSYLGLSGFFEAVETGSKEGPRKAEGIQQVLNRLDNIKSNEIIYVGDAPGDITASRKAGIKAIAAAWAETADPEELKELKPDQIFCTVQDFSKWILSMC
ncbi:phosphoglycolate phosphatase/pyrophosphatase PpaX [Mucilaginibacter gossypiicola]|uniref:phosphoglycolate phosphatase n=1 Tax=Mucilaginibacter gossypiicola TaxID=551995 RepID=A0A1H8QTR8_9SPHI|nr:HAD hydrolase-like protein [Mucilaginibacter gossypiicola]SEO57552.1 phosphoglycolate phosphatase/pyrophosphatase PpaX [Mucilaginibacter gossypiicola]